MSALDGLAMARQNVQVMRDKCEELRSLTHQSVSGHPIGDQLVGRTVSSVDQLGLSVARLLDASHCARGIDVTIEVPDPELRYGY